MKCNSALLLSGGGLLSSGQLVPGCELPSWGGGEHLCCTPCSGWWGGWGLCLFTAQLEGGNAAGMSGPRVDPHGGLLSSPDFNTARVALGSWDDLGPSGLNWIARVGGNFSFSPVDGSETIPEAVPCPGEGAPSASLLPGTRTGTKRRRRREWRRLTQQMGSVFLQAGTSSNSDPQLDLKGSN